MNILAIDTSNSNLLVGLKATTGEYINAPLSTSKHLETLLPEIDKVLDQASFTLDNVDIIGVVVGPGSFKGIRIGVATAKAIMFVRPKIKCVAVNSIDLLAYNILSKSNTIQDVVCVIPSTLKKFYVGVYRGKQKVMQDQIMELAELKDFIQDKNYTVVVPTGTKLDLPFIVEQTIEHKSLFNFIERAKIDNNFVDINNLKPYYLGVSQAEAELLKKETKDGTNI